MNLALERTSPQPQAVALSELLARWYATHASVRRLWAIDEPHALIVWLTIEPTSDGDDTLPVWFARSFEWSEDLRLLTNREVRLQLASAVDDDSIRVKANCVVELDWRAT